MSYPLIQDHMVRFPYATSREQTVSDEFICDSDDYTDGLTMLTGTSIR